MKETSFLLRQVSVFFVSPAHDWKHFQQMRVGQTASILVSLSSNPTSTLTTIWCAFLMIFSPHPILHIYLLQVELATSTGSFDGGDQGLLNTHFSSWATQVKTNCPFKWFVACLIFRIFRSTFPSCTTWSPLPPTPTCPPTRSSAPTWRSSTSLEQTSRGWARARRLYLCQSTGNIGGSFTPLRWFHFDNEQENMNKKNVFRWLPGYRWQEMDLFLLSTNKTPRRHLRTQGEKLKTSQ